MRTPQIGDVIDLKIKRNNDATYIVGSIVGIRQDYYNPDMQAILIGGIDLWITLNDDMEVAYIDE